ncbi:MAG: threonine/serine exporter family protein, partial [Ilumatobacteraceae bacterium]
MRLDQIDDLLTLVQAAERGDIGAVEGQQRLSQIRTSAHPYPARRAVLGYVCWTVGLAVILRATWREVVVAAVIGSFRLSTRRLASSSQPFVPLIAATVVSISVFALARIVDDLVMFPLLVSPLIAFLPGALLTIGVLELATGHIVSGASRLASGVMQLVLVALGLVADRQLVGVPAMTCDRLPTARSPCSRRGSVSPSSEPASCGSMAHCST